MKLLSLRLVAAIAVCLGVGQSFAFDSSPPLFFTPSAKEVPQVLEAINGAKTSFHMIMYRLTTPAIIDALIAAKDRGVDVQVILDQNGVATEKPNGAFHRLSDAKVNVMKSSVAFSLSHVKSFVVDNKTAYIMTLNLTSISSTVRDVGYITSDSGVIGFFNELFAQDVKNSANGTMDNPASIPDNMVLSPGSRPRLEALIATARKSIKLEVENFSDTAMMNDLIAAQKNGVKVQVMMPRCDMTAKDFDMPAARTLSAAGVEVKMMGAPMSADLPYIHQKSIIIDEATVFLGSENFSFNSLEKGRELGVIFSEAPKVRQMVDMFNKDFGVSLTMTASEAFTCPATPFDTPVTPGTPGN
ncbi:MAG: phospholipase D-like domain-containing protein [Bdellovibrionales bacterium]